MGRFYVSLFTMMGIFTILIGFQFYESVLAKAACNACGYLLSMQNSTLSHGYNSILAHHRFAPAFLNKSPNMS